MSDGPATNFLAVTPHNSTNFSPARALYIGVAGDVTAVSIAIDGAETAVLFKNIPAGTILPIRTKRVNATGTTATDIVALL
jgi:hypothetical protein